MFQPRGPNLRLSWTVECRKATAYSMGFHWATALTSSRSWLTPVAIQTNFQQASAVGSSSRAQQALRELHTVDKVVEMTDQLMVSGQRRGQGHAGASTSPGKPEGARCSEMQP